MKILLFFSIVLLSASCRKDNPDVTTVRYEFTSDVSGKYQFDYAVSNTTISYVPFNGTTWFQTVRVNASTQANTFTLAQLTVHAPAAWESTTTNAHVNLKIIINGDEKVNVDTVMTSADKENGIREMYTF